MVTLHLTINTHETYEKVMEFLHAFDDNQLRITSERHHDASEYVFHEVESYAEEPAISYKHLSDDDFDDEEYYKPDPNDPIFLANKRYLEKQYEEIRSGKAIFYTLEEFEQKLDETLAKYETDI